MRADEHDLRACVVDAITVIAANNLNRKIRHVSERSMIKRIHHRRKINRETPTPAGARRYQGN